VSSDRGSASLIALFVIPLLVVGAFAMLAFTQQAIMRQQLRTAADLAALAAAQALHVANCDRAQHIAEAHQVRLIDCQPSGADWIVGVALPAPPMMQRMANALGHFAPDQVQYAKAGYSTILGAPDSNS
jgi:secretion/DNA translocation related TadE-like protein